MHFDRQQAPYQVALIAGLLTLSACGSSGGSSSPAPPPGPPISPADPVREQISTETEVSMALRPTST